jgi:hypothetical protein
MIICCKVAQQCGFSNAMPVGLPDSPAVMARKKMVRRAQALLRLAVLS